MIGGIPTLHHEGIICFLPVTRFAWTEGSYFAFAIVVAAGLDEEGAEGVACNVVFEGVCGAVRYVENLVGGVVAARAVGEG